MATKDAKGKLQGTKSKEALKSMAKQSNGAPKDAKGPATRKESKDTKGMATNLKDPKDTKAGMATKESKDMEGKLATKESKDTEGKLATKESKDAKGNELATESKNVEGNELATESKDVEGNEMATESNDVKGNDFELPPWRRLQNKAMPKPPKQVLKSQLKVIPPRKDVKPPRSPKIIEPRIKNISGDLGGTGC